MTYCRTGHIGHVTITTATHTITLATHVAISIPCATTAIVPTPNVPSFHLTEHRTLMSILGPGKHLRQGLPSLKPRLRMTHAHAVLAKLYLLFCSLLFVYHY